MISCLLSNEFFTGKDMLFFKNLSYTKFYISSKLVCSYMQTQFVKGIIFSHQEQLTRVVVVKKSRRV